MNQKKNITPMIPLTGSSSSSSSRKSTYRKRKKTLKKKAEELSILCGVPVCLVCIEPDGNVETWPQDKDKVDRILKDYIARANLNSTYDRLREKKRKVNYETWDPRLDYLPEEFLIEILKSLERKEMVLEERLGVRDVKKKRKLEVENNNCYDGLIALRLGWQENGQTAKDWDKSVAKHALGLENRRDDKSKSSSPIFDKAISESDCDLDLKLFNNGDSVIY